MSSCGHAPVSALTAAGEPTAPGPDPLPDCEKGTSAAAQRGAGRTLPSTSPFCPGLHAHPDQLPLLNPRSYSTPHLEFQYIY